MVEAGPWAGKTALMVHVADRLRADGMTVIGFFVVERTADQANQFLSAVISQQLDAARVGGGVAPDATQRPAQFARLWSHLVSRSMV